MKTLPRVLALLCLLCLLCTQGVVASAEDFSFTDTQGHPQSLSAYRGKWLVVNFWATWCPPCLKEIPDFGAFRSAHRDKVQVLGIAMDYDNPQEVREFAARLKMEYPLVLGTDETAARVGKVQGLPTTFIFDPQGRLALHKTGTLDRDALEQVIAGHQAGH